LTNLFDIQELVTALRIIEREERSDEDCAHKQRQTGFLPPGRPKGWRDKCMDRLRATIADKIEGNQLETRDKNKMWLVREFFLPISLCYCTIITSGSSDQTFRACCFFNFRL
jgi:hypothetical protein